MGKKMIKDELGNRMKSYERARTNDVLAYHSYYIYARLDGRGFSKFTKNAQRPFDPFFIEAMDYTTKELMKLFNVDIAYVQSDEISLGWKICPKDSEFIFGGKIQKITSLLAAKASVIFLNYLLTHTEWADKAKNSLPTFDCRVFELPSAIEMYNCFEWRYQDATRNFVSQWARAYCSHKELNHVSKNDIVKIMEQKGHQQSDRTYRERFGLFLYKENNILVNSNGIEYSRNVIKETSFIDSFKFKDKQMYFKAIFDSEEVQNDE